MANRMWCVKKGGATVTGPEDTKFWDEKESAKKVRNSLQGDLPENPDHASEWQYHVSPGPDHWRANQ
jgi:hypothetical protein